MAEVLGQLRVKLGRDLNLADDGEFRFAWVTEFPMFEYSLEEKRLVAKHHPFTAPLEEDLDLLETEPEKVRARSYDLVLNGNEIGGGSIRIHLPSVQARVFKALGIGEEEAAEKFGFLVEALGYGAPPHGGLAFGFDRLNMLLSQSSSIRDVIAFPKTQKATCPMTGAPAGVDRHQLLGLGLRVEKKQFHHSLSRQGFYRPFARRRFGRPDRDGREVSPRIFSNGPGHGAQNSAGGFFSD